MKKISWIFTIILLASSTLFAQATFEGTIDMTTTIPMLGDQEIPMTVSIKGDLLKILTEAPGIGELSIYVDKPNNRIVALLPALNMGTEFDLAKIEQLNADSVAPVTTASGKKEKIGDYNCESFSCLLRSGVEMELWATKEMPNTVHRALFNSYATTMKTMRIDPTAFEKIMNDGYAPIRTVISKNGTNKTVITMKKFEAKAIADEALIIPADVKLQKIDPTTLPSTPESGE